MDHAEIECSGADEPPPSPGRSPRSKPTGRRNLAELDLPEERIEILDPTLEGVAERIGFEDSYQIGYRRGGPIRIVKARAVYKMPATDESSVTIVTAPNPKEIYDRAMLAPSAIAHILTRKFCWGMPFHRLSKELASYGFELEDSTMGRYAEHVGATLGAIIAASAADVLEAIVHRLPAPTGDPEAPLQALIFDSWFDAYRGVIVLVRVMQGTMRKGQRIRFMSNAKVYEVESMGVLMPKPVEIGELKAGEVGFFAATIKNVADTRSATP